MKQSNQTKDTQSVLTQSGNGDSTNFMVFRTAAEVLAKALIRSAVREIPVAARRDARSAVRENPVIFRRVARSAVKEKPVALRSC